MKVFSFPVLTAYARTDCNTICRCWVSSRSCSYWVPVLRTRYYHTVYSAVGDLSHFSLLTSHLSPTHLLHRSYRSKHNDAVFSFSFWLLAPPPAFVSTSSTDAFVLAPATVAAPHHAIQTKCCFRDDVKLGVWITKRQLDEKLGNLASEMQEVKNMMATKSDVQDVKNQILLSSLFIIFLFPLVEKCPVHVDDLSAYLGIIAIFFLFLVTKSPGH